MTQVLWRGQKVRIRSEVAREALLGAQDKEAEMARLLAEDSANAEG